MRRIAIINQKGGVGKTTTAVNLASALALRGQRVCLFDLDPQAHATTHFGIEPTGKGQSLYDVLVNHRPLASVLQPTRENLWLAPADINLAAAELELSGVVARELILRDQIAQHIQENGTYDFLLMDCAPSLGVLTLNALAACEEVFIPLQPHFLALHGMSKLLETTALVARRLNPALKVSGIILSLYESAARLGREVVHDLQEYLDRSRDASVPWANASIFTTRIRRNVKLAECPSFGQSIFEYAPKSNGAEDYQSLAAEVMGELPPEPEVIATRIVIEDSRPIHPVEQVQPSVDPVDGVCQSAIDSGMDPYSP